MALDPKQLPTPTEFAAAAQPLTITITRADGSMVAQTLLEPKLFQSGGYGWFGQIAAVVAGLRVNGSLSLSVSKSKEAPKTREQAPATGNGTVSA